MKKRIKILLINPSSMPAKEQETFLRKTSILRVPSFSMPIGLIELSAYLRSHIENIDIRLLDIGKDLYKAYLDQDSIASMTLKSFTEMELDSVDFDPDIIGISILFSSSHNGSMLIIDQAKKKWPKATIICGGNHATNCATALLSNQNLSFVLRGEGELPFTEFVGMIQSAKQEPDVYGIIDRKKLEGNQKELSPLIMDLNEIPLPAYDLLDIEAYKNTVGGSLMTSRGCVFKCTFCASHTVHGRNVRFKSNKRILSELRELIEKYHFDKIVIEDDLFAAKKNKFIELVDEITRLNYSVKYFLPQGLSVSILDNDIIDAMIRMGIDEGSIAIESGSPYVQKEIIRKNVNLRKTKSILHYLRKKEWFICVNFIFGFPGETRPMMQETIDFIRTLDVDWVYIFHALPLPGSDIYTHLLSNGIINENTIDWDGIRLGRRVFDTPEISANDLENIVYDTNIEVNFFGNKNLNLGRYKRALRIFDDLILDSYPFHVVGRYCKALSFLFLKEKEKAEKEFRECVLWIERNDESRRLYERYGDKMEYLKPYMEIPPEVEQSPCEKSEMYLNLAKGNL